MTYQTWQFPDNNGFMSFVDEFNDGLHAFYFCARDFSEYLFVLGKRDGSVGLPFFYVYSADFRRCKSARFTQESHDIPFADFVLFALADVESDHRRARRKGQLFG